jgi:exonuclease III
MNKERVDIIALQETHTKDDDLRIKGYIAAYVLVRAKKSHTNK